MTDKELIEACLGKVEELSDESAYSPDFNAEIHDYFGRSLQRDRERLEELSSRLRGPYFAPLREHNFAEDELDSIAKALGVKHD